MISPRRPLPLAALASLAACVTSAYAGGPIPTFLDPTPYLSTADSPFDLSQLGVDHILEDFEDGQANALGLIVAGPGPFVKNPSATTDSVDADDGAIDGFGLAGHTLAVASGQVLTIFFDPVALGGYPTEVGFVWTDGAPNTPFSYVALDANGLLLGFKDAQLGDTAGEGATAEDRFFGVQYAGGISGLILINTLGELEIDHLQYTTNVPTIDPFLGPTPYTSKANSPFDLSNPLAMALEDFEDGALNTPGISANFTFIVNPSANTDSVDGDDGVIDGFGKNGHSLYSGPGQSLLIEFDPDVLQELPTKFGVVWTDGTSGADFTMKVRDEAGNVVAQKTWQLGDAGPNGSTAEDRFVGINYAGGIKSVELLYSVGGLEIDHIQYNLVDTSFGPVIGPQPYLSKNDTPFGLTGLGVTFLIEDFEDGLANTPGLSMMFDSVINPSGNTDSVDGDDGVIDGFGKNGHSAFGNVGQHVEINFNAATLGDFPTKAGVVWTDGNNTAVFTFEAFDAGGVKIAEKKMINGDGGPQGSTAEDRFVGIEWPAGISKLVLSYDKGGIEFDHVQYDRPNNDFGTVIGPQPYLSKNDTPFGLTGLKDTFFIEDFEDGLVNTPGLTMMFTSIINPSANTDSVDGDDGAIDGFGKNGHSAFSNVGQHVEINFSAAVLGAYPTQAGVVWTDGNAAAVFKFEAFDGAGVKIAQKQMMNGDNKPQGSTAEDRFIGIENAGGISKLVLSYDIGGLEFDHVQYNRPNSDFGGVIGPTLYQQLSDSPFDTLGLGSTFFVEDLEDSAVNTPGLTATFTAIIAPSNNTDSVDADDGVIDGLGRLGHSLYAGPGTQLTLNFNPAPLSGLPTEVGLVWTDGTTGTLFTFEFYDGTDTLVAKKTSVLGDTLPNGSTPEDRFFGLSYAGGISKVIVKFPAGGLEVDHIQYNSGIRAPNPADLNGDGIMSGDDLGLLLANWGTDGIGDINEDGTVDGADLGILLFQWNLFLTGG